MGIRSKRDILRKKSKMKHPTGHGRLETLTTKVTPSSIYCLNKFTFVQNKCDTIKYTNCNIATHAPQAFSRNIRASQGKENNSSGIFVPFRTDFRPTNFFKHFFVRKFSSRNCHAFFVARFFVTYFFVLTFFVIRTADSGAHGSVPLALPGADPAGGSGARSPSPLTMGASAPKAQERQYPSISPITPIRGRNYEPIGRNLWSKSVVIMSRGGTCIFGRHFYLIVSSEGGIFSGFRAPGCGCGTSQRRHLHLVAPFSPDWELRGRLFHVQRAPVFLRDSRAAFASCGAVFIW